MLVDGGFENAAYDLKYHLRGLAVQIFYRIRSAPGDAGGLRVICFSS